MFGTTFEIVKSRCAVMVAIVPALIAGLAVSGCDQATEIKAGESGIYRILVYDDSKMPVSSGTGFLVSDKNLVATNRHVVSDKNGKPNGDINIVYIDKLTHKPEFVRATIKKIDDSNSDWADLAILWPQKPLPGKPLTLADYKPKENTVVKAVGFPGAADQYEKDRASHDALKAAREKLLKRAAEEGQLSEKRKRELIEQAERDVKENFLKNWDQQFRTEESLYIATPTSGTISRNSNYDEIPIVQHQAPINGGNSGGPLIDDCDTVVGVNTFKPADGQTQGIFMAVGAQRLISQIKSTGENVKTVSGRCLIPGTTPMVPFALGGTALFISLAAAALAFRRTASGQRGYTVLTGAVRRSSSQPTRYSPSPPAGATVLSGGGVAPTIATGGSGDGPMIRFLPVSGGRPFSIPFDQVSSGAGAIVGREPGVAALIEDASVSKRHARLTLDRSGRLAVEDLGSSNGCYKNGQKFTRETFGQGETVRFGRVEFRVELPGQAGEGPRAAPAPTAMMSGLSSGERTLLLSGMDNTTGRPVQLSMRPHTQSGESAWVIGRRGGNVDLIVDNKRISGEHARIRYLPDRGFEICDLGSSNGTKVDGRAVARDYVSLQTAKKVTLGDLDLTITRS